VTTDWWVPSRLYWQRTHRPLSHVHRLRKNLPCYLPRPAAYVEPRWTCKAKEKHRVTHSEGRSPLVSQIFL